MYSASYIKHPLTFIKPAGTSRGVLLNKSSYFIILRDREDPQKIGLGECSIIPGLSPDPIDKLEVKLKQICKEISTGKQELNVYLPEYPSLQFGFEIARQDLNSGGKRILFPSKFTEGSTGILINGLIWMGEKSNMLEQVRAKIYQGFTILKLKVGAISFEDELSIINSIRKEFKVRDLEIRLDANGAWETDEAKDKLDLLSKHKIHSIEQPISAGQIDEMANICSSSSIPIALDEELIGLKSLSEKEKILNHIKPQYIILKPSLLGGIKASEEWIELANKSGIAWWVTSALESNIGLNAIAQWTATLGSNIPQGLGTGSLFSNNIPSPLEVIGDKLYYLPKKEWDLSLLKNSL